jgi:hypothetical protein
MTVCSQNLSIDDLQKLKDKRQQDPTFDQKLAVIVKDAIASEGSDQLQQKIDAQTLLLIQTPTPDPEPDPE